MTDYRSGILPCEPVGILNADEFPSEPFGRWASALAKWYF
jgi:hypothetical protein